ncbi:unnamed protein product, partial [Laminaria digitata]
AISTQSYLYRYFLTVVPDGRQLLYAVNLGLSCCSCSGRLLYGQLHEYIWRITKNKPSPCVGEWPRICLKSGRYQRNKRDTERARERQTDRQKHTNEQIRVSIRDSEAKKIT